jgi:hypothetical protein
MEMIPQQDRQNTRGHLAVLVLDVLLVDLIHLQFLLQNGIVQSNEGGWDWWLLLRDTILVLPRLLLQMRQFGLLLLGCRLR